MALAKRIIAVLLIITLFPVMTAFAQTSDDIYAYLDENTIVAGGTSQYGEGNAATVIIKYGTEVVYINFGQTGTDGKYEFYCTLDPETDATGTYEVILAAAGETSMPVPGGVVFVNKVDAEALLSDIKNSATPEAAEALIAAQNSLLGLDLGGDIMTLTDKAAVYSSVMSKEITSIPQLKKEFDIAVAIEQFNESTALDGAELLALKADILGVDADGLFADIKTEALKTDVYEELCGNDIELTAKAFQDVFIPSVYTALFNGLDSSDREMLITYARECNEKGFTEFNLEDYEELSQSDKVTLMKNMIKEKNSEAFEDLAAVEEAFQNEIDDANYVEPEKKKPSSSGGGGGGIKLSVSYADKKDEQDKTETEEETKPQAPKPQTYKFNDLSSALWAQNEIEYLAERGIVSGRDSETFDPDGLITREEFVKLLVGALKLPEYNTENSFNDVKDGDWYYEPVMKAYAAGIVKGVDFDNFGVGESITREQVCTIIYRAMMLLDIQIPVSEISVNIADQDDVSDYALQAVESMFRAGIVSGIGDGSFNPGGFATRAQTAKIIYGVLERIGEI